MKQAVHGLHHITAIAGDPQTNVNFYVGALGLRMVKRTVNYDDPGTYHFYYGDDNGSPGTILTFFPWANPYVKRGQAGLGQAATVAFAIPPDALGFWTERLKKFGLTFSGPQKRFNEDYLVLADPDGMGIELVAAENDPRPGRDNGWIPAQHAIRGFHSVAMPQTSAELTAKLLTDALDFNVIKEAGSRLRFAAGTGAATMLDLIITPHAGPGKMGPGAIHHVAWRTTNDQRQLELRDELLTGGYHVSPVMDRNYFHSIYFREPGHVLFEIATDPPGFAVDEAPDKLGQSLRLPPWLEPRRSEIESSLPKITLPTAELTHV